MIIKQTLLAHILVRKSGSGQIFTNWYFLSLIAGGRGPIKVRVQVNCSNFINGGEFFSLTFYNKHYGVFFPKITKWPSLQFNTDDY